MTNLSLRMSVSWTPSKTSSLKSHDLLKNANIWYAARYEQFITAHVCLVDAIKTSSLKSHDLLKNANIWYAARYEQFITAHVCLVDVIKTFLRCHVED